MIINLHAGHNYIAQGATDLLNEVEENRKVLNFLLPMLRTKHIVYDCTDNEGKTGSENLKNIVKKCNERIPDINISLHLNAGRNDHYGDGDTGGVEVWGYDNHTFTIGSTICENISEMLNIRNRGFKINPNYYVLKHTVGNAIIIECCFVDDKDDVNNWSAKKCAEAIAAAFECYPINITIKLGDTVKVKPDITTDNKDFVLDKNNVKNRLYYEKYNVIKIDNDNVLIGVANTPTCWINKNKIERI